MWIKMLKTYAGPLGVFPAGQKFDLPESTVQQLKKEKASFIKTGAPWDEQKDEVAILAAKDKGNALYALSRADKLQAEADRLLQQADDLVAIVSQNQTASQKADADAKKAIEKSKANTASKGLAKKAFELARKAETRDLISQKVQGEFQVARAVAGLKRIEAEDAKKYAEQKAKEAGLEQSDEPA